MSGSSSTALLEIGLAEVAPQLGALCGVAARFAALGIWRFRFERQGC